VSSNPGCGTSTDLVAVVERMLNQAAGSSPDLSVVASKRPGQQVSQSIENAPSITSKVDWEHGFPVLPDASQGDSTALGTASKYLVTLGPVKSFKTPGRALVRGKHRLRNLQALNGGISARD
jgi:hypothetical protein